MFQTEEGRFERHANVGWNGIRFLLKKNPLDEKCQFNAVTNAERWTINFAVQHPNIALSFSLFHFIALTSFLYACVYHSRPLFCLFSLSFMLYLRRAYLTNFASYIHNNICLYVVVRPLFWLPTISLHLLIISKWYTYVLFFALQISCLSSTYLSVKISDCFRSFFLSQL